MARRAFKLPDIGEGVVEGEIVTWHVEVGSSVSEDDAIVDVMTDKSTVTIPSPYSGTIVSLNGDVGDMVAVGAVLVEFDSDEANVVDEAPVETEAGAKVEDEEPGAAPPNKRRTQSRPLNRALPNRCPLKHRSQPATPFLPALQSESVPARPASTWQMLPEAVEGVGSSNLTSMPQSPPVALARPQLDQLGRQEPGK